MRKTVLFISMSLDGYIADPNGKIQWLNGQDSSRDDMDTYTDFIKGVDTIFMGWNTYHQIVTELSPGEWIYEGMTTYVFTHHPQESTEEIRFTKENPASLLKKLKEEDGKNIWICGGANLISQLMPTGQIDRYSISVIPTLLGKGIRLFQEFPVEQKLSLIKTQSYNGITDLVYEHR